jgi:tryptophan 2,3-dioxygenase
MDYLNYWDYINLDALLALQIPRTTLPDEVIFIHYHQITELYFKLAIHELKQMLAPDFPAIKAAERVKRVERYFDNLVHSFTIMVDGMEPEQFLKFRMALLPSSGFQSAQYRVIEIMCTDLIHLVARDNREAMASESVEKQFDHLYWKQGAKELATGNKTLTLKKFEARYGDELLALAKKMQANNLNTARKKWLADASVDQEKLTAALRELDMAVNVHWPLSHYRSAIKYLNKEPQDIAATGGTNWQKFLPPRHQFKVFFPDLFSADELQNWGKTTLTKVFG